MHYQNKNKSIFVIYKLTKQLSIAMALYIILLFFNIYYFERHKKKDDIDAHYLIDYNILYNNY